MLQIVREIAIRIRLRRRELVLLVVEHGATDNVAAGVRPENIQITGFVFRVRQIYPGLAEQLTKVCVIHAVAYGTICHISVVRRIRVIFRPKPVVNDVAARGMP